MDRSTLKQQFATKLLFLSLENQTQTTTRCLKETTLRRHISTPINLSIIPSKQLIILIVFHFEDIIKEVPSSGETEELTSDSEPEVTNQIQEHQLQETTSQMLTPEKKLDLSHSPPTSTDQPGARLLAFHNAWRAAPPGIYSITKKGFHWTWKFQPPTLKYPTQITTNQNADLNLAIENLIKIRVIYQVPLQPCFLSPIFLVPKRTRGYRLIINLKQLNKFVEVPHFHMTNHVSLAAMLKPPAWAASLDLKDAYFHVPIKKTLHKYLAFMVHKKLFFFKALPFGLGIAPFLFTRIMRYPLGLLHQQGISVLAY